MNTPDLTPEAVDRLAKSLAFVANRTGMTVEKCEHVTDDAAAALRTLSARVADLDADLVSAAQREAKMIARYDAKLDKADVRAERAEAALATARDDALEAAAKAVFGAVTQDPQKTSEEVLLHASRIIRAMKGGAA